MCCEGVAFQYPRCCSMWLVDSTTISKNNLSSLCGGYKCRLVCFIPWVEPNPSAAAIKLEYTGSGIRRVQVGWVLP